jgi:DNA-directed RNA polymerase beta' subunit
MEAARQCIYNELSEVLEFDGAYVNAHHMSLLCDRMTFSGKLISIFRHGINNDDIGPIAKASFEETPEMFLKAARHAELDTLRGISANVMCGQEGLFGTACFQVVLDINEMISLDEKYKYEYQDKEELINDGLFKDIENPADICSKQNLEIQTNGEIWYEVYSHYKELKYVHELQNLFYALTNEELGTKTENNS